MNPYYSVIYNRSDGFETSDSILALKFVEFLVEKISGWGYEGYFADRDAIPGRSIFDELFRTVSETEKTIVVITPEFRTNYWAKYSKQAALKYLIDQSNHHKLIPIVVGCDSRSLKELNVNEPICITGITEAEWKDSRLCFDRLKKAFGPRTQPRVVEETGDNRLRTEERQQLVTRPSSETSLSSAASTVSDESPSTNDSTAADNQRIVIYDRSIPDPILLPTHERQIILHQSTELNSVQAYDGDIDTEELPNGTKHRFSTERDPTARLSEQIEVSWKQSSAVTNADNDRNREISNSQDHVSLSDDTDLTVDVLRSLSVPQGTDEDAPRNSLETRPETLGAECLSDTRPEIAKLSLGLLKQDDRSDTVDSNQTIRKDIYTTLSEEAPSTDIDYVLQNQTDDDKFSGISPSSDASPCGGTVRSMTSTPRERGNSNKNSFMSILQSITMSMFNIDKAYQN